MNTNLKYQYTGLPFETLIDYAEGRLTDSEKLRVEQRMESHPDDREVLDGILAYRQLSNNEKSLEEFFVPSEDEILIIEQELFVPKEKVITRPYWSNVIRFTRHYGSIAAAILILLLLPFNHRLIEVENSPKVEIVPQINTEFSASVFSAGDVNADGYDDIIAGAFQYNIGLTKSHYVLYGNSVLGTKTGIPLLRSWYPLIPNVDRDLLRRLYKEKEAVMKFSSFYYDLLPSNILSTPQPDLAIIKPPKTTQNQNQKNALILRAYSKYLIKDDHYERLRKYLLGKHRNDVISLSY